MSPYVPVHEPLTVCSTPRACPTDANKVAEVARPLTSSRPTGPSQAPEPPQCLAEPTSPQRKRPTSQPLNNTAAKVARFLEAPLPPAPPTRPSQPPAEPRPARRSLAAELDLASDSKEACRSLQLGDSQYVGEEPRRYLFLDVFGFFPAEFRTSGSQGYSAQPHAHRDGERRLSS